MKETALLVIGAGPYGLAIAALAKHHEMDFQIHGKPLAFWKVHMPVGMHLRSEAGWHMDPLETNTLVHFLAERALTPKEVEPIPIDLFLEYGEWFLKKTGVHPNPALVSQLSHRGDHFEALLEGGETVIARSAVVAPGFRFFKNVPDEIVHDLPADRYCHTSDFHEFEGFKGSRCLIIGGRQSAFETAALLRENGAQSVDLVYRHATPMFTPSDWSWIDPLLTKAQEVRGWFRNLSEEEKLDIQQRFWMAGRFQLEPWLSPRIEHPNVQLHPQTTVLEWTWTNGSTLAARVSNGEIIETDRVILATGYKVDVRRMDFLSKETILDRLKIHDGYPALDEDFQSNIPGLYFTGLLAANDFGPFFGFIRACPFSARVIVRHLQRVR